MEDRHIAIFASGNGTNAENLIRYFGSRELGWKVSVVVCNRADAGVLDRARRLGVPSVVMPKASFADRDALAKVMDTYAVDAVVLAGFLLMIPLWLIARYPRSIINIHPSLLPKYGGRGMYGRHVHEAVVAAGERESGITVHLVNETVDGGAILFQAATALTAEDTPADVEAKIHQLEQRYFPQVVAATLAPSLVAMPASPQ
ncbi:MAG: phosphoribosylglycinamide formyltransferase [Bacteroidales bacterium]|nr:phosphoribosylglycinamide formyltransferase [Bacteroidales bacterium]